MKKIPVLYYHDVVSNGEGYSYQKIEEHKFDAEMKYLYDNGYKTVKLIDIISNGNVDYKKRVVITFDDGFKGVAEKAVPILRKYGFCASVFVSTGLLDTDGILSKEDAVKYSDEGILELCAHTETHPDMSCLSKDEIREEFSVSNEKLMAITKIKPYAFCIPFGSYNKKTVNGIFTVGDYEMVFASFYGFLNTSNFKGKLLPRIGIKNDDSLKKFVAKVKGRYNFKGYLQRVKYIYKNIRGIRLKFNKDGL